MTARYKVERTDDGETFCDDAHPVRFSRKNPPEHYPSEPWARRIAIDEHKRGYLCPGNEPHGYTCWVVFDTVTDDNVETHDSYREAKVHADRLNEEEA